MSAELQCESCNWMGLQRDCRKKYITGKVPEVDVEPYLVCPKCGSEDLIELSGQRIMSDRVPVLV